MENVITILISAILSGVFATIITLWWQDRADKVRVKREIFITLMAYRFKISQMESVKALNCVQAIFYNDKNVQKAWVQFKSAADKQPFVGQDLVDSYISLLEEIAKVLKYKNIAWKDIKGYYYPSALLQELDDTELLRKVQLQVALQNVQTNPQNNMNFNEMR